MVIVIGFFVVLFALIMGAATASTLRRGKAVACVAMAWSLLMFVAASSVERLNYNIWYSATTRGLLDAVIGSLEAGKKDEVVREFRTIREEMDVTYEKRGNYRNLVEGATERLGGRR